MFDPDAEDRAEKTSARDEHFVEDDTVGSIDG